LGTRCPFHTPSIKVIAEILYGTLGLSLNSVSREIKQINKTYQMKMPPLNTQQGHQHYLSN
jgi:hypothetical protein